METVHYHYVIISSKQKNAEEANFFPQHKLNKENMVQKKSDH